MAELSTFFIDEEMLKRWQKNFPTKGVIDPKTESTKEIKGTVFRYPLFDTQSHVRLRVRKATNGTNRSYIEAEFHFSDKITRKGRTIALSYQREWKTLNDLKKLAKEATKIYDNGGDPFAYLKQKNGTELQAVADRYKISEIWKTSLKAMDNKIKNGSLLLTTKNEQNKVFESLIRRYGDMDIRQITSQWLLDTSVKPEGGFGSFRNIYKKLIDTAYDVLDLEELPRKKPIMPPKVTSGKHIKSLVDGQEAITRENTITPILTMIETLSPQYIDMALLQLHTGTRVRDITKLDASKIDYEKMIVTLPSCLTKTKTDYIIPITEQVKEILQRVTKGGDKYPFLSNQGIDGKSSVDEIMEAGRILSRNFRNNYCVKCKQAGLKHTAHGERSLLTTWAIQEGCSSEIAMALTQHDNKSGKNAVEAAYSRSYLTEQKRGYMTRWSDLIQPPTKSD